MPLYISALFFFPVILAAAEEHPSGRIIGGENASITDFPYQLSLLFIGRPFCGASVISSNWAVTAGHCLYMKDPYDVTVLAGTSSLEEGGNVYHTDIIIVHESYNDTSLDYDIGLLKVRTSFEFGSNIKPIKLPDQDEEFPPGTLATVTGWGDMQAGNSSSSTNILKKVDVPLVDDATCHEELSEYDFTSTMLCAGYEEGGKDSCSGDSGGPLVADGKQIGIVSWGDDVCAAPKKPGVYTKMSVLRKWIDEHTEGETL